MQFPCTITKSSAGSWTVRYAGGDLGRVEATANTRDGAIEKMQNELRYRLELCPCSGEVYRNVEIKAVEVDA